MTSTEIFAIGSVPEGLRTLEILGERFASELHPEQQTQRTYFDTFDWRVRRSGHSLSLIEGPDGKWLHLEPVQGGRALRIRSNRTPVFVRDLPEGPIRSLLEPVVEMRRFLACMATHEESRTLDVRDEEDKTICRAVLERGSSWRPDPVTHNGTVSEAGLLPSRLRLIALRGYDSAAGRVSRLCREELQLASAPTHGFDLALTTCGITSVKDPSKPRFQLEPGMPAEAAVRTVLRAYLDVMEANEDGVRRDLDTEFLHDYRVAVRRTRSILSTMKGVFAPAALRSFKEELRWLGGITGTARDLDVYLMELEEGRDDLDELSTFLRERRREEQQDLVQALDSDRYRRLIAGWRAFLSVPSEPLTRSGSKPIRKLAGSRLLELHDGFVRRGRSIKKNTPAAKVHRARILGKKLRYMLDAFRLLFDEEEVSRVIRRLKKIQDVLGRFNDFEVQQVSLERHAEQMASLQRGSAPLFVLIGREIEDKQRAAENQRREVVRRFREFDDPTALLRFQELFEAK